MRRIKFAAKFYKNVFVSFVKFVNKHKEFPLVFRKITKKEQIKPFFRQFLEKSRALKRRRYDFSNFLSVEKV